MVSICAGGSEGVPSYGDWEEMVGAEGRGGLSGRLVSGACSELANWLGLGQV